MIKFVNISERGMEFKLYESSAWNKGGVGGYITQIRSGGFKAV